MGDLVAMNLVRFDHGREHRPHVLGWGEELPFVHDDTLCDRCGKTGYHDVIQLSHAETISITKRPDAQVKGT